MPSKINQHETVPVHSALVLTDAHMDDLKVFLTDLFTKDRPPPAVLSDNQFQELKTLLQPGFELSTLMLAEYRRSHEPARVHEPAAEQHQRDIDAVKSAQPGPYEPETSVDPEYAAVLPQPSGPAPGQD